MSAFITCNVLSKGDVVDNDNTVRNYMCANNVTNILDCEL